MDGSSSNAYQVIIHTDLVYISAQPYQPASQYPVIYFAHWCRNCTLTTFFWLLVQTIPGYSRINKLHAWQERQMKPIACLRGASSWVWLNHKLNLVRLIIHQVAIMSSNPVVSWCILHFSFPSCSCGLAPFLSITFVRCLAGYKFLSLA